MDVAQNLQRMVRDAIGVFREGTGVNALDVRGSSGVDIFQVFHAAMCDEISRTLVGQTLARSHGTTGSYAQARTHEGTGARRSLMDETLVVQVVNAAIALENAPNVRDNRDGVPLPIFQYREKKDMDALVKQGKGMYEMGWRPTEQYFTEGLGVPESHTSHIDHHSPEAFAMPTGMREIEEYIEEQLQGVSGISRDQITRIGAAVRSASSPGDLESRLLGALDDMPESDFFAISGRVLAAAEMYGRMQTESELNEQ